MDCFWEIGIGKGLEIAKSEGNTGLVFKKSQGDGAVTVWT